MDYDDRIVMMDKRTLQAVNSMQLPHKYPHNLTLSDGTLAVGQMDLGEREAGSECAILINPEDLGIETVRVVLRN